MPTSERSTARAVFFFVTASHWPSGDWGECTGWCCRGFTEEARVEEFLLMIILCHSTSLRKVSTASFFPPCPGGPARSEVGVSGLSASGPLIDGLAELLSTWKGCRSVPSMCEIPLRWVFPRHLGLKSMLQQSSRRCPVRACVRPPPVDTSLCGESALWPPPPTFHNRKMSTIFHSLFLGKHAVLPLRVLRG